jgi:Ca-activated chloride channel homolog
MTFAHPWLLALLPLVPVAVAAWFIGQRRGRRALSLISRGRPPRPRYLSAAFLAVAVALGILAAAQPRWGEEESTIPRQGAQLIIVLDVSRSMAVDDVLPTRLDAAKQALTATLDRLGGDRVGLVMFAGDARLRFPLTTDFAAAAQVIQSLETGAVLVDGGTDAASGLDIALSAFDQEGDAGRMVVLVTDGDDLGADPAGVAERVRASGIDLLVMGAGTPAGGRVKVFDPKTKAAADKLGADGKPIVSALNEPFLRALAAASGGRYLGADLTTLPGAVAGRLTALKRAQFEREAATIPIERFQWFAGAALVALVLGSLADARLPGRRSSAVGALSAAVALVLGCATAAHDLNEQGRAAFALSDFGRAADLFTEAQAERPNDATVSLNLAAALYAQERYDEGLLAARRALNSPSAKTRARAQASIGHFRFAMGDLPAALDAFRQGLIEDPGHEANRHDYEVVWRLLHPDEAQPDDPTPTPAPGEETPAPGAQETPTGGPGEGPGLTPSPGAGSPSPGPGGPGPNASATPAPGGTPAPGEGPLSPEQIDRILEELDRQITAAIAEAGEELTAAEALEILKLLQERARIAAQRDAASGGGDPGDY